MGVLTEIEMSINERVIACYKALEYHKMKAGKTLFAEVLGIDKANLSKYFAFNRPFPLESLVKLTVNKKIDGHWLLTGDGEMFKNIYFDRFAVILNAMKKLEYLESDPQKASEIPVAKLLSYMQEIEAETQKGKQELDQFFDDMAKRAAEIHGLLLNASESEFAKLEGEIGNIYLEVQQASVGLERFLKVSKSKIAAINKLIKSRSTNSDENASSA